MHYVHPVGDPSKEEKEKEEKEEEEKEEEEKEEKEEEEKADEEKEEEEDKWHVSTVKFRGDASSSPITQRTTLTM